MLWHRGKMKSLLKKKVEDLKQKQARKKKEKQELRKSMAASPRSLTSLFGKKTEKKLSRFLSYRARLIYPTTNADVAADTHTVHMFYIQALSNVIKGKYPVSEQDIVDLGARQCQIAFGNKRGVGREELGLGLRIEEFVPAHALASGDDNTDDQIREKWESRIYERYNEMASSTSPHLSKISYLEYCQRWPYYGGSFFSVEQREFKDWPSPLDLAVGYQGVVLLHPTTGVILEHHRFELCVTWGVIGDKDVFLLVVGDINKQEKRAFKSSRALEINQLMHDWVKMMMEKPRVTAPSTISSVSLVQRGTTNLYPEYDDPSKPKESKENRSPSPPPMPNRLQPGFAQHLASSLNKEKIQPKTQTPVPPPSDDEQFLTVDNSK